MAPVQRASGITPPFTRWHQAPEVLLVAQRWKERCLLRDGSMFTDRSLWTRANFDQLERYYVQNLKYGEGDFYSKLKQQLAPATPEAKQLAAELFWLMFLYVDRKQMRGSTKRLQIRQVWEWSGDKLNPTDPTVFGEVLDGGIGRPGTAYNTERWRELVFLIDAIRDWKGLSVAEQSRMVADPWLFAFWLDAIPTSTNRQFREVLLHLLFPDTFERIATARDKQKVVRAFRQKAGEPAEGIDYTNRIAVDREILRIRESVAPGYGVDRFDFYHLGPEEVWRDKKSKKKEKKASEPKADLDAWYKKTFGRNRVWVIATGSGGRLWPEFEREKHVAIEWDYLGDLSAFESRDAIRDAMIAAKALEHDPMHDSLAVWNFVRVMQPGDTVIAKRGLTTLLAYGVVTSDYRFDEDRAEARHVRDVDWRKIGPWELGEEQRIAGKTLTEFSALKDWLRSVWPLIVADQRRQPGKEKPRSYSIDDALKELFMPRDLLQSLLDALGRKKNLILEGAPGVGKTFVARRIAYALMGVEDAARVDVVQFHQSYSYEDFVQGWRPLGEKGFSLQKGRFVRFCETARKSSEPFVFIIDEINRGNLSKVFGELLSLLEGDKRGPQHDVGLAYDSAERFHIPANVYLIGLMNTADRSLAMVDYALRRRFAFVRLEPAFESEAFAQNLVDSGVDEEVVGRIVAGMTALNTAIAEDDSNLGEGYKIGHSFFVPADDSKDLGKAWYQAIVRQEIEPLLREYWFDQPEKVKSEIDKLLA
jgi:MoxR-like ATPase